MRFAILILCVALSACSIRSQKPANSHFEFSPALEAEGLVLKYDKWSVTQSEFFTQHPEFRAFQEEYSAVQTAVALEFIIKEVGADVPISITGCSREACLMSLHRVLKTVDEKKLSFRDAQGKNTITAAGKTYDVQQLPLNNLELARLQTSYYLRGQNAAEDILIRKILTDEEKKTLGEGTQVTQEEFKSYLKDKRIDPKAIGLRGVTKVKEALLQQKVRGIYKKYTDQYIYKGPVLSRWKKPSFKFENLPLKTFNYGRGKFKLITVAPYDCHNCLNWNQDLPKLMVDQIHTQYFPASSDNNRTSSLTFYEAAFCLQEQDEDAPWKMFEEFKNIYSRTVLKEKISEFISSHKLNQGKYETCVSKNSFTTLLEQLMKFSQGLGVKSYPVVVAGDFVFMGDVRLEDVRQAILIQDPYVLKRP